MTLNSSKLINPSPFLSTPLIIFLHSAREQSSPKLLITFCNSSADMTPFPSMSFSMASSESTPLVFSSTNSFRSINPSPSASTSTIIFSSSSSVAGWPRLPMMDPNSEAEILPSPLTSNFLNTCSSSAIWVGVSSDPEFVFEFVVVVVVVVDEL
ncbi:hypothetical protein CFP56_015009 [Quercus suber]|uniref:Uncharacterized protein n=1 Tax=Quercus suber TaxID=58331 RepID=A0AAW0KT87_QUESU